MKKWHWRDVVSLLKLKLGYYTVRGMCGKCKKCNGIFAACGCIPCPHRFSKESQEQTGTPVEVMIDKYRGAK